MTIVEQLREGFATEAKAAPRLFRDLASVEKYIAESYKTRALIELLQNADDAGATEFGLHDVPGGFAACNNGSPFVRDDIEALCRSGASHKVRGGATIGYRGIGFKSVVNLANLVAVISGEHSFCFSRELTKRILGNSSEVPLVRVPHPLDQVPVSQAFAEVERLRDRYGYKTVFLFLDINERLAIEDLSRFQASSVLFLRSLLTVRIEHQSISRTIESSVATKVTHGSRRVISDGGTPSQWRVFQSPHSATAMIAVQEADGQIVPAPAEESVFHSFTPTENPTGLRLKINGDYSTDPSRSRVDFDDRSLDELAAATELLHALVDRALSDARDLNGLFSALTPTRTGISASAGMNARRALADRLATADVTIQGRPAIAFASLRSCPDWLNYDDYEGLTRAALNPIPKQLMVSHPDILAFLNETGVPFLSLQEALINVNSFAVSELGAAQMVAKVVKQYRFDLSPERAAALSSLRLWFTREGPCSAQELHSTSNLSDRFLAVVQELTEAADLAVLFRKLGIHNELQLTAAPKDTVSPETQPDKTRTSTDHMNARKVAPVAFSKFQRWRSAEQNAAEYLRLLDGVQEVTDVSRANLGYDLEVILEGGGRLQIEVKSVSYLGEPFRLTNNEYTTAHQFGDSYCLALVVNSDSFEVSLIRNPLHVLDLHKQCERWAWFCDEYKETLQPPRQLIQRLGVDMREHYE